MVITGKSPHAFFFIFLGLEGIVFIGKGLTDVLTLHEMFVVEIYLKKWRGLAGCG